MGVAGLNGFDNEPYRPPMKCSLIGDKALGSKETSVGEVVTPSRPSPFKPWCSSSGGGVGVLGGAGIGSSEAMTFKSLAASARHGLELGDVSRVRRPG